jgi:hypothetical protein
MVAAFTLTGKQLNGQSAGASYGDDDQMNSNHPIIRMVDQTGNVFYARTTNWTSVGVDGPTTPETVNFTLNLAITPGNYSLIVSGAGISSFPAFIEITLDEVNRCFRHQMLLSRTKNLILNRERCCRVDEREHDLERCQKDYFQQKIFRSVSRLRVNPACMACVRSSRPNFMPDAV